MAIIRWSRHPSVAANDWTRRWLQIQADMGLAQNTVDAYGRGLEEFLRFLKSVGAPLLQVNREHVAGYVRFVQAKPGHCKQQDSGSPRRHGVPRLNAKK